MLKHKIYKDLEERTLEYQNIFNRYKNMSLNMFRWENLPSNMESRHIELALFEYGNAMLFKPTPEEIGLPSSSFENGYLILGANCGANFNVLGDPTTYVANGYGQTFNRHIDECVICRNNPLSIPSINYIKEFADKMNEVSRSIKANVKQQKFPFIIPCTAENEFTMKTLFDKISDGNLAIFKDESLDLSGLKVLDTRVPFVVDKLSEYRFELEREILTFHGLNNNFEKKERLLTDEINANNDYIDSNIDLMFNMRKHFCKKANEKYGLNIQVYKNYDVKENIVSRETNETIGGNEDE